MHAGGKIEEDADVAGDVLEACMGAGRSRRMRSGGSESLGAGSEADPVGAWWRDPRETLVGQLGSEGGAGWLA